MKYPGLKLGWLGALLVFPVLADQPVMNEVPRWNGGYGAQVFQEWRASTTLMRGGKKISNPEHLEYEKQITHIEGVYTWTKALRVTLKQPWVDQKRRVLDETGSARWQRSRGWDDTRLALPIRQYINKPRSSGHVGVVPQLRFGGERDGAYPVSDGSTDYGMSATFEHETAGIKVSGDLTCWWEQHDGSGDEWSVDFVLGYNFHDRGAISWETEYIVEHGEYEWLGGGPALFWNFNDVVMGRIEYKWALDEQVEGLRLSRGDSLRIGLGVVY